MKYFLHRLLVVIKSRLPKKRTDWLKEVEDHVGKLEQQLNNVSVSLSKFKAHESLIRSDLEAALVKIDKISRKLGEHPEGSAEQAQLEDLQRQCKAEALGLGEKLKVIEQRQDSTRAAYHQLRAEIQNICGQLDDAKARYYTAETRHTLYGDASGVSNADGVSKFDHLFDRIKTMESEAEAFCELAPLEMKIDGEVKP